MPKGGKRAIVRCRDDHISAVPVFDLGGCRALHLDGHQPDAALHYAKLCREAGILTSLDGGGLRTNTHELLEFIDVAIVAERLCEQMDLTPEKMLDYLKSAAAGSAASPWVRSGLLWYDEAGKVQTLPALPIPRERVIDTNGAGDVFHGAYVYSYLANPGKGWESISSSRARRRPSRSSSSATKPACRRSPTSRSGQAGVRRPRSDRTEWGLAWGASSSPAASIWTWWRPPSAIRRSARRSPAEAVLYSPGGKGANQAVAAAQAGRADHAGRPARH